MKDLRRRARFSSWLPRVLVFALLLSALGAIACSAGEKVRSEENPEALSRTEFTSRIENYFEYQPLKAGRPSQFLIHLTDLSDGSPVEKAEVLLTVRTQGGAEVAQTKARVGKVTGIYVADVAISSSGDYEVEFHITNPKLDERMRLSDFRVE